MPVHCVFSYFGDDAIPEIMKIFEMEIPDETSEIKTKEAMANHLDWCLQDPQCLGEFKESKWQSFNLSRKNAFLPRLSLKNFRGWDSPSP